MSKEQRSGTKPYPRNTGFNMQCLLSPPDQTHGVHKLGRRKVSETVGSRGTYQSTRETGPNFAERNYANPDSVRLSSDFGRIIISSDPNFSEPNFSNPNFSDPNFSEPTLSNPTFSDTTFPTNRLVGTVIEQTDRRDRRYNGTAVTAESAGTKKPTSDQRKKRPSSQRQRRYLVSD